MASLNYARLPHGRVTQKPKIEDYETAVHYLEAELEAARHDGLSLRFIRIRADLAAYRSLLRRLYWRQRSVGASTTPTWF